MEQHAVPQPITSYEFRLVGDMTLKQFGKLAAGIILALIVYGINPPAFIKWPLIILFSLIGAAMAFVPFEGRPIDVWLIAFFKRIYSPTQYVWKQKEKSASSVSRQSTTTPSIPLSDQPLPPAPKPESINVPLYSQPAPTQPITTPQKINLPPPPSKLEGKKVEAKFIPNFVVPATPSLPNLIVGFARDKQGKLIEGAILEIRDSQENPVRAFKTSKLGQFLSATPLHNGSYEIETEKEGYEFDIIKIDLDGKILPPIEIVSK